MLSEKYLKGIPKISRANQKVTTLDKRLIKKKNLCAGERRVGGVFRGRAGAARLDQDENGLVRLEARPCVVS